MYVACGMCINRGRGGGGTKRFWVATSDKAGPKAFSDSRSTGNAIATGCSSVYFQTSDEIKTRALRLREPQVPQLVSIILPNIID